MPAGVKKEEADSEADAGVTELKPSCAMSRFPPDQPRYRG